MVEGSNGTVASDTAGQRWEARRGIAFSIRATTVIFPLTISILTTQLVARLVERPEGLMAIGWWSIASLTAVGVFWTASKIVRRLAPAIMLYRLSLVFPDVAPSRFKMALRTGTTRQLQGRLNSGNLSDLEPSEAAEYLLSMMSHVSTHDRLTRGHSERVRAYSALIATELQLSDEDADKLQWGALLHDIGKLEVPAEILNSPNSPTEEQWEVLRKHPGAALNLMTPLHSWLGEWSLAASQHHERWDGAGYPDGLHANEISLAGRIVAVADAYDVMTAARSYKKAISPALAKEELTRCAGTQFDPRVVRAFLRAGLDESTARWAPLAWLGNLPGLAQVPAAAAGAGTIVATSVALAATATLPTAIAASPLPSDSMNPPLEQSSQPIASSFLDAPEYDSASTRTSTEPAFRTSPAVAPTLVSPVTDMDPTNEHDMTSLPGRITHRTTATIPETTWVTRAPNADPLEPGTAAITGPETTTTILTDPVITEETTPPIHDEVTTSVPMNNADPPEPDLPGTPKPDTPKPDAPEPDLPNTAMPNTPKPDTPKPVVPLPTQSNENAYQPLPESPRVTPTQHLTSQTHHPPDLTPPVPPPDRTQPLRDAAQPSGQSDRHDEQ